MGERPHRYINGLTSVCKGCGASIDALKPHFRSLPPVGETAVGPAWCEECIIAGKSDLDASLVDYVKNLHQSA